MNDRDTQLFKELARGAHLIFENAESLYSEAERLGTDGAFARALALHQISIEECSKLDMVCVAATSLLMGHPVNLDDLANRFRRHKVKNYNSAYVSVTTDAERDATKAGDSARAIQIFETQQAEIHRWMNTNKNASLYVDYSNGRFTSPSEQITEEVATHIQQLNGFFLRHASDSLQLLRTMAKDPDVFAARATDFASRLEQLKTSGGDLEEQFQELVAAWLEEQRGKARAGSENP